MSSRKNGESLTTKILLQIRDEIRNTRQELSARIDSTNQRLDTVVHEQTKMRTQLVELKTEFVELKTEFGGLRTEFGEMKEAQREFAQVLGMAVKELQALGNRIDNVYFGAMGKTVREHEERIVRLEQHASLVPV